MVLFQLLTSELVMDILSRLPKKGLVRFMSVSKSWRSLVYKAMYMHFRSEDRNSNYITIIPKRFSGDRTVCQVICINGVPFEVKEIEIPIRTPSECYSVLCSCYGRIYCMTDDICRFFYLWNPSKSTFRTIPYPPDDRNMMTTSTTHGPCHWP